MLTFGLTGGIAVGKSTVSKTLHKNGIPTVDADIVARQVVEPGTPGLQAIVKAFGAHMLLENGTLNRSKMSEEVFSNPNLILRKKLMETLNALMSPLIQEESSMQLKKLHDEGHALVCYDAALICEMGNADKFRPLVVVACQPETQIARLMLRNGLTRERAMDIISVQLPVEQKIKMADFVIRTDGSIEESIKQTEACIRYLKQQEKQL